MSEPSAEELAAIVAELRALLDDINNLPTEEILKLFAASVGVLRQRGMDITALSGTMVWADGKDKPS